MVISYWFVRFRYPICRFMTIPWGETNIRTFYCYSANPLSIGITSVSYTTNSSCCYLFETGYFDLDIFIIRWLHDVILLTWKENINHNSKLLSNLFRFWFINQDITHNR